MENFNNKPLNNTVDSSLETKKEPMTKKIGDAVERFGDKVEHAGMKKVGDAIERLGDKIEHSQDKKQKSA